MKAGKHPAVAENTKALSLVLDRKQGGPTLSTRIVIIFLSILFLTGCMPNNQRPYINLRDLEAPSSAPTKRTGEAPLRIVVSPSLSNRDTAGYYRQLADHVAVQTGHPTELIYRRSNAEAQALLASAGADIGFFPQEPICRILDPSALKSW